MIDGLRDSRSDRCKFFFEEQTLSHCRNVLWRSPPVNFGTRRITHKVQTLGFLDEHAEKRVSAWSSLSLSVNDCGVEFKRLQRVDVERNARD